MDSIWLITANTAAGFFAASLWWYFAIARFRHGKYLLAAADLVVAVCALTVGLAYLRFTLGGPAPTWIRWLVTPLLVVPSILHLASWIRARRFIAAADPGDGE